MHKSNWHWKNAQTKFLKISVNSLILTAAKPISNKINRILLFLALVVVYFDNQEL